MGLEFRNQEESSSDLMANDKKQLSSDLIANDKNESKSKTYSTSLESTFSENGRVQTARIGLQTNCESFGIFLCSWTQDKNPIKDQEILPDILSIIVAFRKILGKP